MFSYLQYIIYSCLNAIFYFLHHDSNSPGRPQLENEGGTVVSTVKDTGPHIPT